MSAARRSPTAGRPASRPRPRRKPIARWRRTIAPPDLDRVSAVGEELDAWAHGHRVSDERRRELMLAYDELASNVANHARRATRLGIEARRRANGAVVLVIEDDGARFDPLARARPRTDQSLADRPIGGLGILLVRELSDSVRYERRAGRNRILVVFHA